MKLLTRRNKNRNLNFNGKKANVILDGIMILIVLFIFTILTVIAYKVFNDTNTDLQADADLSATAKTNLNTLNTRFPIFMDNAFVIALVLLTILAIAFSFYIDTNPFFLIVVIILLLAVLFVGGTMTNSYEELVADADLSSVTTAMPKMNFIMTHLIETILIISFMILIALYGKSQQGI